MAFVAESYAPLDSKAHDAFLEPLSRGLAHHVTSAMAIVCRKHFGGGAEANRVAILDASGYSPNAERWKIELRICFLDRAVAISTAQRLREGLVQRLAQYWQQHQGETWAMALEAPDEMTSEAAAAQRGFWDRVVDEKAYSYKPRAHHAPHRLCYCDVLDGDPAVPEGRPLRPSQLLLAKALMDESVNLEPLSQADVSDTDWIGFGSSWTNQSNTEYVWAASPPSSWPASGAPQGAPGRAQANASAQLRGGTPVPRYPGWLQYVRESDGKAYYHNESMKQTVWELPELWAEVRTPEGKAYYHNLKTDATSWTLPEGAILNSTQTSARTAARTASSAPSSAAAQTPSAATAQMPSRGSAEGAATAPWHHPTTSQTGAAASSSRTPMAAAAPAASASATQASQVSPEATAWREYRTPEGKPYYHNPITRSTVWKLPPGAVVAGQGR